MSEVGRIADNLQTVRRRIDAAASAVGRAGSEIQLVAVSKFHPPEVIVAAHAAGQRDFGENRVQELVAKARALAHLPDLRWHLIGSLQSNKVRELATVPGLVLLHSLDRPSLADSLQVTLAAADRSLPVLLQIKATDEDSKHGVAPAEALSLLRHVLSHCPALQAVGVMAMGPVQGVSQPAFARVVALRELLRAATGLALPIASLGMSGDLEVAVSCGATMVRVGTDVFGPRP